MKHGRQVRGAEDEAILDDRRRLFECALLLNPHLQQLDGRIDLAHIAAVGRENFVEMLRVGVALEMLEALLHLLTCLSSRTPTPHPGP